VFQNGCFNPCFDGLPFWTFSHSLSPNELLRFNPCFDGLPFWTWQTKNQQHLHGILVSILVLMDYLFGRRNGASQSTFSVVSILVLMDYLFGLNSYNTL